jgi:hypothetical protein
MFVLSVNEYVWTRIAVCVVLVLLVFLIGVKKRSGYVKFLISIQNTLVLLWLLFQFLGLILLLA